MVKKPVDNVHGSVTLFVNRWCLLWFRNPYKHSVDGSFSIAVCIIRNDDFFSYSCHHFVSRTASRTQQYTSVDC